MWARMVNHLSSVWMEELPLLQESTTGENKTESVYEKEIST